VRILLAEDDRQLRESIARGLREATYAVDDAPDGGKAVFLAAVNDYDAIILDVVLPVRDGIDVCREIRRRGIHAPVLMLTARDTVDDKIKGLDAGADDYLTKPFDFGELLARMRAVIRRGRLPLTPAILEVGNLRLDLRARQAYRGDDAIKLTSREFALLEFLVLHAGEVVGRAAIAEHVWDASFESMSNVIDVMIQRLRRKIDDPRGTSLITTRRGEGYMMAAVTSPPHRS